MATVPPSYSSAVAVIIAMLVAFVTTLETVDKRMANAALGGD
jgi:hypothetical protein